MTIEEIISKVDDLSPNQYTQEQKIGWLSTLDGKIYNDVILTHADSEEVVYPDGGYTTDEHELIVQKPYAEDLYTYYLLARVAEANTEIAKYSQWMAMYNAAYSDWANYYNRTHMPNPDKRWVM